MLSSLEFHYCISQAFLLLFLEILPLSLQGLYFSLQITHILLESILDQRGLSLILGMDDLQFLIGFFHIIPQFFLAFQSLISITTTSILI